MVFNGNPDTKYFDVIDCFGNANHTNEVNELLDGIDALRKFSKSYFKNNKVPLSSLSSKTSSDFDLIGKVFKCEQYLSMFKVHL